MRCVLACLVLLIAACGEPSSQTSADEAVVPPLPGEGAEDTEMASAERDTEPRLSNGHEVLAMLNRLYPETLKEEGVGGRVLLWMHVDESGNVTETKVQTSSGYPALDEAAQAIADSMLFTPAENKGAPVSVWIAQPIEFAASEQAHPE